MTEHAQPQPVVSRRTVLRAGAMAFGSFAVAGALPATRAHAAGALTAPTLAELSIGYVANSRGLSLEEARAQVLSAGTRVVPAKRLRSGAQRLEGGAVRVRVDGLTPGLEANARPRLRGLQVDALYPAARGTTDAMRYYAWTLNRDTASDASAASFVAPVRSGPSFGFAQRSRRIARDGSVKWSEASALLTPGTEARVPKLRPGTYLLGLSPDTWSTAHVLPGAEGLGWRWLASVIVLVTEE